MPKLWVVTPVRNNLFFTKLFLRSLDQQTFKDFGVVVVDNGSVDETKDYLLTQWIGKDKQALLNGLDYAAFAVIQGEPNRKVVYNHENRGYAGGANDGINAVLLTDPDADIVLTNNDMELYPTCLEELVKARQELSKDVKIGVLGGRLLFPDGRIQHGGAFLCVQGWGAHKFAGLPDRELTESEPTEQEYVTGALFYMTSEILKEQRFDELFNPAYFEEVDFCTSAREKGFKTFYVPTAKAVHYESKTSDQMFGSKDAVSQLSRQQQQKYYLKHDKPYFSYIPTSNNKALLTGKIYGEWSFSIVLRNLAKGLKLAGVDVAIAPEEYHNPFNMDEWEIQEMIKKPHDYWDRVVMRSAEGDDQYLMPPGKKRVAHTTFETTRLHQGWVEQLNHVDQIVTNSSYCKGKMEEFGIKTPIGIVPNPVDAKDQFFPEQPPLELQNRRKFGFLIVGAYGDRKNIEAGIRAFVNEFRVDEDVFLSVHSLSLFWILQQNKTDVRSWIRNSVCDGKDIPHPPILVTSQPFHPLVLPRLFTAHDVYVMPSRCEGFGNGIIEAAACGLPSIATNYSGMTDFLSEEVAYPVGYKMQPMPLQLLPYFRNYVGSQWAEINLDELQARMRYAFDHPLDVKQRGIAARRKSLEYDIRPAGQKLSEILFS